MDTTAIGRISKCPTVGPPQPAGPKDYSLAEGQNTADASICRIGYHIGVETYTTRLEKSGRILIPVALRRRLGLSEGSPVIVKLDKSGGLQISSRSQALAKVRQELRKYIPAGRDLAVELIRDRRAEVKRENEKASRR